MSGVLAEYRGVTAKTVSSPPLFDSVAHDAQTQTVLITTAATIDTTHTPVGTPKGAVVIIVQAISPTPDEISGVTYGGVTMSRVVKLDQVGVRECGSVYIYFLGSGVPTGAQTVSITSTGTASKRAVISTVTATGNTAVEAAAGSNSQSLVDPTVTFGFGRTLALAVCYYGLGSGLASVITTVQAGGTHQFSHDFGAEVAMWARKSVSAVSSTTIGYTASADDVVQAAVAIKDA